MASSSPRTWRYHVFASFHGPDVRKTFLSHLRRQFNYNGITMFDDQGIERGQTIAPSLTEAIRESRILIVVLSKNYASSRWCLNELVEILEYKKSMDQIVIMTVFYGVDPCDVRRQTGEFGIAFKKTCARKTEEDRRRWSQALEDVGNIAGEHFLNWDSEAKMMEKIARDVSDKLNVTPSWDFDGMVGFEAHLRKIESLLDLHYNGVKIVAIYGPAGIGKTTIARALQSLISNEFQLTCFMENLRGSYHIGLDEYGLKMRLQENLLSSILDQHGTRLCHLGAIKDRLCDQKVLIILDDVNDVKQLEALANETTWFGPGSRIVVTTENKKLLQQHGINDMYHVGFPSNAEALKILCKYAFKQSYPHDGFESLAFRVIELCGNLPLGLRVVGSCLYGTNEDEWEQVICRLNTNIDREIEDILRVGYESLNESEQRLFLHIAVFSNNIAGGILKAVLTDNDLDIEFGLKILVNKSLIYISTDGEVVMHNLLQLVARQAIHRQEPWKRQILIDSQEICNVLENDTGSVAVSGISFDTSGISEVVISNRALRRMRNLRFLHVYKSISDGIDRVHIPEEMEFPPRLRLLHWNEYPSKSLPLRFCMENLVELNLRQSQLEKLWEGPQPLTNLKKMDLSYSFHLKKVPDLSNVTNLESLNLTYCDTLVELQSSIGNLHKLEVLNMSFCESLEVIPTHINLASLDVIQMGRCSRLRSFPDISTNVKELYLNGTAVEETPSSLRQWSRLSYIITSNSGKLKTLTHFPESVVDIQLSNTDIEKIPDCISGLQLLKYLGLSGCKNLTSLPELPPSLQSLSVEDCESLERVTCPLNIPHAKLNFTNCFKLCEEARSAIIERPCFDGVVACLPGRLMPSEFNHRVMGNSLTVPLTSESSTFKACVIISPRQLPHGRCNKITIGLECYIIDKRGRYNYERNVSIRSDSLRDHLLICYGKVPKVRSDALFEFIYDDDALDSLKITECGIRILTDDLESSNDESCEGDDDSSYNFELEEVLEESEDGVISCDSESESVERKKKHIIDCWSWLFVCFDLSNLVRNIGSLCWERKQTESRDGRALHEPSSSLSYKSEHKEVVNDSRDGLISCDSETENVEKKKKRKLAWIVISERSQLRTLRLPDSMLQARVVKLLYTNSGVAILALADNAVHKLWKWQKSECNLLGKANINVPPQLWQPSSGILMTNDTSVGNKDDLVPCFAVSKNDSYVISASGGKVSLFNKVTLKTMTTFMEPLPAATSIIFHPQDNNIFAIGMDDSSIRIYNVRKDEVIGRLKGHQKKVTGLAFSTMLNVLVSSGADSRLCVWSMDGWEKQASKKIRFPSGRSPNPLAHTRVQFHQDQTHVLLVHPSLLAIYEGPKLEHVKQWIPRECSASVTDAVYSCDSQSIYATFDNGSVRILTATTLQMKCRISPSSYLPLNSSLIVYPTTIAAHPSEPNQFAVGLTDGGVHVFEPPRREGTWGMSPTPEHTDHDFDCGTSCAERESQG